ncbi:MAG TPA: preprotein translocase subunit YajC [Alphaproteobacteria bacterium]|nr:preprotein translocase subunit YajC [Alphaproteobacteria bacterium]
MHWNVILADAPAPASTAPSSPPAQGTSTSQAAPAGQTSPQASPFAGNYLILMVLLVVIMYFMTIRPQQQRAKQMAKLLSSLKAGDKVITSSGIVGVVITVKDKTVSLRSADAKMEVTKSSITEILQNDDTQTTQASA